MILPIASLKPEQMARTELVETEKKRVAIMKVVIPIAGGQDTLSTWATDFCLYLDASTTEYYTGSSRSWFKTEFVGMIDITRSPMLLIDNIGKSRPSSCDAYHMRRRDLPAAYACILVLAPKTFAQRLVIHPLLLRIVVTASGWWTTGRWLRLGRSGGDINLRRWSRLDSNLLSTPLPSSRNQFRVISHVKVSL